MSVFPLQNSPYDSTSTVSSTQQGDDGANSIPFFGQQIFNIVYVRWFVANLQYISMWAAVSFVFLLVVLFSGQFVRELKRYGLLMKGGDKTKDEAKDSFFFSFTGSIVYGAYINIRQERRMRGGEVYVNKVN